MCVRACVHVSVCTSASSVTKPGAITTLQMPRLVLFLLPRRTLARYRTSAIPRCYTAMRTPVDGDARPAATRLERRLQPGSTAGARRSRPGDPAGARSDASAASHRALTTVECPGRLVDLDAFSWTPLVIVADHATPGPHGLHVRLHRRHHHRDVRRRRVTPGGRPRHPVPPWTLAPGWGFFFSLCVASIACLCRPRVGLRGGRPCACNPWLVIHAPDHRAERARTRTLAVGASY